MATPPKRAVNVGLGAALGGTAVSAAMGLLAGTFMFGENLIPADGGGACPSSRPTWTRVLIVAVGATAASRQCGRCRSPPRGSGRGGSRGMPVGAGMAAAGYSTDLDQGRRDGVIESPADVQVALGSLGGGDEPSASVSVGDNEGRDETESDDGGGAVSASPSTVDTDSAPPSSLEPPPPDPATSSAPPPTPAPDAEPAPTPPDPATSVAPPPTPAPDAEPAPTPDPAPTLDAVPTDVDPGFRSSSTGASTPKRAWPPRRVAHIATCDRRPRVRYDTAPVVSGGETCALGRDDAVIPFSVRTTPYNGGTSEVQLSFSQSLPGLADTLAHPMAIEFNDFGGKRCVDATSADIDSRAATATSSSRATSTRSAPLSLQTQPCS